MNRRNLSPWLSSLTIALACAASQLPAQSPSLGVFEGHADVGTVLHPGTAAYDPATHSYTLTGSGENMWITKDAFQFLFKKASGDVAITADIRFPKPGGNEHRKAALLLRQSLDTSSVYADAALHGAGLTALQFRSQSGAVTGSDELNFTAITDAPGRFRLEKRGDHITMFVSHHGEPLHFSGAAARVHFEGSFYIGLGVCAHDKDAVETAVFSNVEIKPLTANPDVKSQLYSTLKTISTDHDNPRAVIAFSAPGHFEAPNWTRDGKALIFDQSGRIMTVPVDGGTPQAIDIGQATGCNGSHGLSPDGKLLAISCATPGNPGSRVYIVPTAGGTPRMITQNPSSYFHSWSPDGKTIAFTRPHPGGGDIFSISVEGGAETRLTDTTMSDDPDYSPDGKFIYFNSDRTAVGSTSSMQIWRMNSDGSHPEQITTDERNNWTPHVAPDGKTISYLSYDKAVTGHPANKDISLRILALPDAKISNVVDIFGGTGTINVPSWSPDSHHFAFVSYELINP